MADECHRALVGWLGLSTLRGGCATAELPRACVPPDAPCDLVGGPLAKHRIRGTWPQSANADVVFHPEQSFDCGEYWRRLGNARINGRALTFVSLKEGVSYRYCVRAFNRCGVSAWSNVASAVARQ